jgi:hypothetical protein
MAEQYPTKILRVRDASALNLLGGVTAQKAIDFTLDGKTVHTVIVPAEGFTAEKARAAVEVQAAEIRKLLQSG